MAVRATSIQRDGEAFDAVVLDAEERHIRRKLITLRSGTEVLVDFERAQKLEHGDRLVLDDGRLAEVIAADEALMEVKGGDTAHLNRLAWHIGNRHLPAQIEETRILIRRDRVIAVMLMQLGAELRDVEERFTPEHGAYHLHDH
jgi:urease accessory protein